MTKTGDHILRRFEGLAKIALKRGRTKPRTTIDTILARPRRETISKVANNTRPTCSSAPRPQRCGTFSPSAVCRAP